VVLAGADPATLPPLLSLGRARHWTPLPLTIKEGRAEVRAEVAAGITPSAPLPEAPRPGGTPILQVDSVRAGWDQRRVLREITFELYPGEVLALMGRNGSGKSTLLRVINGLHRPTGGRVLLRGQDTSRQDPADIAQIVGYLPQNPSSLFFAETVADELAFTLKHQTGLTRNPQEVLETLGLAHAADRHPRDLSGGERERAALAAVLVGAPQVLLLDEPTRGMDAARQRQLVALLRNLQSEGVAIILATHDVELVAEVANRVALLGDGRIVAEGTPREVLAGSLAFTTAVNKLYGGAFLTPQDILGHVGSA
jgi:energy-coupling factor transport system ATP-binding protein